MMRRFARCRDERRAAAALLALVTLTGVGSTGGCHHFTACHDRLCDEVSGGTEPDEPPTVMAGAGGRDSAAETGAERAGAAGEAGAGAQPPAGANCPPQFADCDESTLTSCETNLDIDLGHCGACNARCFGFCSAGKCHELEFLTPSFSGVEGGGSITVTDDAVYALVDPDDRLLRHLVRYDKVADATDTLLLFSQRPDHVLATTGGLYLFHDGTPTVWRVNEANVIKVDELQATSVTVAGSWLYAAGPGGIVARNERTQAMRSLPLPELVDPSISSLELGANGRTLVLLATTSDDLTVRYSIYRQDTGAASPIWQTVASGAGTPTRLRVTARAAYALVDLDYDPIDADAAPQELREHAFDGTSRVLQADYIVDFAIDNSSHVYLTPEADGAGLRVFSLANPKDVANYPMLFSMNTLELDEHHLYVATDSELGLSRVPLIEF
ncbi:MAG: hypothetical protein EOO73_27715 [Myxococcales bacterium]|nr:MAG: hypothetical protein EOO73_27715 [Myxococcales bacterium]